MENKNSIKSYKSTQEQSVDNALMLHLQSTPIPDDQIMENLGLFLSSKDLSRILFMHHIYKKIIEVPGVVMDFGTRWGNNLSLFSSFRSIYEPFNRHRKLLGFDTFDGFPSVHDKDGKSDLMAPGNVATVTGYEKLLDDIMANKEAQNPLSHIKKFEVHKGDASKTLATYLDKNPHTIVALAYFDFDIYSPTFDCLNLLKDRLVKGSILGFDELNDADSPGETLALMEVFGLRNVRLRRLPITSRTSYFEIE
ncbi:crotonobetainyl-CoA--carnitine CoA-transferase [Alphaproteobacteria bacterium]|nr:crotonobetainyl-CoA--carnitine CoA-transferase [Alphaproteobacteria bacterium]